MSTQFSTMKTNVASRVQEGVDSPIYSLLGTWLNRRYKDILRRYNYQVVDEDYSFNTVAGTQDYAMPSDFGKEILVFDSTNNTQLAYISLQDLLNDFESTYDSDNQGVPSRYTILDLSTNTARSKKMRLHPVPDAIITLKVPYQVTPADLSASTDIPVIDCEDAMELGATADAWAYKRQFAKSQYFEGLYEKAIQNIIWGQINQANQIPLFHPAPYDRDGIV